MTALHNNVEGTLELLNKEKCEIVKFSPPAMRDGIWSYGFDVKFPDHDVINHLEFSVQCTGWEINGVKWEK